MICILHYACYEKCLSNFQFMQLNVQDYNFNCISIYCSVFRKNLYYNFVIMASGGLLTKHKVSGVYRKNAFKKQGGLRLIGSLSPG